MAELRWLLIMRDRTDTEVETPAFTLTLHTLDEPGEANPRRVDTVDQLLDELLATWYRHAAAMAQPRRPDEPQSEAV